MDEPFLAREVEISTLSPMLQDRFPCILDVDPEEMLAIVTLLLSSDGNLTKGSSFVYDTNAPADLRRLWLSEVSRQRLDKYVSRT